MPDKDQVAWQQFGIQKNKICLKFGRKIDLLPDFVYIDVFEVV
jgi:hypothetical protein